MNSKSKTGDNLVASIRKSKSGTVADKTSERTGSGEPTAKSKASSAKSASTTDTNQGGEKIYRHSRRVWPD